MNITREDMQLFMLDVLRNSKLSKSAKLQMANYVKEASNVQLKALIMDGEIVSLDEQAAEIVSQRFDIYLQELEKEGHIGVGALIGLLSPIPLGVVIGGVLGNWWYENKTKVKRYCEKKHKDDPRQIQKCIAAGKQAMDIKVAQAKKKAAAKRAATRQKNTPSK